MGNEVIWREPRKRDCRPLRDPFFLFCEGVRTEANYFGGFRRLIETDPVYRDMVVIVPCGSDTLQIVREARRYVEKHQIEVGQVWCVFDRDDFPLQRFHEAIRVVAALDRAGGSLRWRAAWSNECIEFWFVLHFADYRSNNHREEYLRFLKRKMTGGYRKNREDLFEVLLERGSPRLAARYARRILEENAGKPPGEIAPGTAVYALAEALARYLPEEVRGRFL